MVRTVRTPEGFRDILEEGNQLCITFTDSQELREYEHLTKAIQLREETPVVPVDVVDKGQSLI